MNEIILNEKTVQFQTWFATASKLVADYYATNYPSLTPPVMTFDVGRRYIKVINETWHQSEDGIRTKTNSSVWAFIDRTTGDVLKPASWNAPAKHARGNVFNDDNGSANLTPYGPPYMK